MASEQAPAPVTAPRAQTPEAPGPDVPRPAEAPRPEAPAAAPAPAAPTPAAPAAPPAAKEAPPAPAAPSTSKGNATNGTHGTVEEYGAKFLFDKMLTTSDAGGHGRVVIPKVHARAHLPSLDDKAGMHLECVDTFGGKHRFRYCSWINNSSRMYLLEGVAPALTALKLKAGDILIFGSLPSGEFLLGGRARTAADKDRKAPPRARKSEGAPGAANGGGGAAAGIKRRAPMASSSGAHRQRTGAPAAPFRPPCDGVFRAVPPTFNAREYCGKILQQAGAWTAILDLAGEAYQAFFDSQGAAFEALNAAGVPPPKLPSKQPAPAQAAHAGTPAAAGAAAAAPRLPAMPQPQPVQSQPQPMQMQPQPMAAS